MLLIAINNIADSHRQQISSAQNEVEYCLLIVYESLEITFTSVREGGFA